MKKSWVTKEILELKKERKKIKYNKSEEGKQKFKELQNKVNRECNKARETYKENKFEEVEHLIKKGRHDLAYKIIKTHLREPKKGVSGLKD